MKKQRLIDADKILNNLNNKIYDTEYELTGLNLEIARLEQKKQDVAEKRDLLAYMRDNIKKMAETAETVEED